MTFLESEYGQDQFCTFPSGWKSFRESRIFSRPLSEWSNGSHYCSQGHEVSYWGGGDILLSFTGCSVIKVDGVGPTQLRQGTAGWNNPVPLPLTLLPNLSLSLRLFISIYLSSPTNCFLTVQCDAQNAPFLGNPSGLIKGRNLRRTGTQHIKVRGT